jgi:hypothetical protein
MCRPAPWTSGSGWRVSWSQPNRTVTFPPALERQQHSVGEFLRVVRQTVSVPGFESGVCSSIVVFACARRVLSLLTFAFSRTTLCDAQTCGASQHLLHFRNAMRHPMIRGKSLTVILNEIFKQRVVFALQYALAAISTDPTRRRQMVCQPRDVVKELGITQAAHVFRSFQPVHHIAGSEVSHIARVDAAPVQSADNTLAVSPRPPVVVQPTP